MEEVVFVVCANGDLVNGWSVWWLFIQCGYPFAVVAEHLGSALDRGGFFCGGVDSV